MSASTRRLANLRTVKQSGSTEPSIKMTSSSEENKSVPRFKHCFQGRGEEEEAGADKLRGLIKSGVHQDRANGVKRHLERKQVRTWHPYSSVKYEPNFLRTVEHTSFSLSSSSSFEAART